ncbi:hypothetical protein [Tateyamaria sp. SN3-11]|uniref:hypothetical protein n=1 Tax=Tateyamaria sp. SN3-11 TaxID=3092147 RepID=UPI0039E9BF5E
MCIASDTIGSVGPVTFHPGRGPRPVPYWLAMAPDAAPGVPPLVAVHGIRRGAQQQATLFAKRAAAMGRHVIAPLFNTDTWAGYQQAFLRGRADLALLDVLADLRLRGVITSEHVDLFGFSGVPNLSIALRCCIPRPLER